MNTRDLSILDRPEISEILFHPRKAPDSGPPESALDISVPVSDNVSIGCRFFRTDSHLPHLLFFHGNGEIAADYDPIGPIYNDYGLNFMVADYRGYGKSTGAPTVSAMLSDAHLVLDAALNWMENEGRTGRLWLMGRSLGSAPALELAASRAGEISGLIIESGFAYTVSLLRHLGIDAEAMGIKESEIFSNADKISHYTGPTLIMHAEQDHIIPLDHGKSLYQASPAQNKDLEIVENANHNTLMMMAGHDYFRRIRDFIRQSGPAASGT